MGTKGRDHLFRLQDDLKTEYKQITPEEREGLREWLQNKRDREQHALRLTQSSRAADVSSTLEKIENMVCNHNKSL